MSADPFQERLKELLESAQDASTASFHSSGAASSNEWSDADWQAFQSDALRLRDLATALPHANASGQQSAQSPLVRQILAKTSREDLSWRGDLRLVKSFMQSRLSSSWALRFVAASLIAHLLALPVVGWWALQSKPEPTVIQTRIVPPFESPFEAADVEQASRELQERQAQQDTDGQPGSLEAGLQKPWIDSNNGNPGQLHAQAPVNDQMRRDRYRLHQARNATISTFQPNDSGTSLTVEQLFALRAKPAGHEQLQLQADTPFEGRPLLQLLWMQNQLDRFAEDNMTSTGALAPDLSGHLGSAWEQITSGPLSFSPTQAQQLSTEATSQLESLRQSVIRRARSYGWGQAVADTQGRELHDDLWLELPAELKSLLEQLDVASVHIWPQQP